MKERYRACFTTIGLGFFRPRCLNEVFKKEIKLAMCGKWTEIRTCSQKSLNVASFETNIQYRTSLGINASPIYPFQLMPVTFAVFREAVTLFIEFTTKNVTDCL